MLEGQPYNFKVWISFLPENLFWNKLAKNPKIGREIWSGDWNLTNDLSYANDRAANISIPWVKKYKEIYTLNKTMYLHFEVSTPHVFHQDCQFSSTP